MSLADLRKNGHCGLTQEGRISHHLIISQYFHTLRWACWKEQHIQMLSKTCPEVPLSRSPSYWVYSSFQAQAWQWNISSNSQSSEAFLPTFSIISKSAQHLAFSLLTSWQSVQDDIYILTGRINLPYSDLQQMSLSMVLSFSFLKYSVFSTFVFLWPQISSSNG